MALKTNSSVGVCEFGSFPAFTTSVNSYADAGVWSVPFFKTKIFTFGATTNNLLVTVLGSRDGGNSYPTTVEADIAVAAAGSVEKTYTTLFTNLKVQAKPAANNSHGTLSTKFYGVNLA